MQSELLRSAFFWSSGYSLTRQDSKPRWKSTDATVLISGGIDSAACAHFLMTQVASVRGLFIDYGQAANRSERFAAKKVSRALDLPFIELTVAQDIKFGSGELVGRNAFLVLSAILLAGVHRGLLALGIHAGTPYYDCSPVFLGRMKHLAQEYTDGHLTVVAPFVEWTKAQIFDYFKRTKLPIEATYSCEAGTIVPCGTCVSCKDRRMLGC